MPALVPEEEPILADLSAAGYNVRSLTELRGSGARYKAAIPILLRWLPRVTDRRVLDELVRTLSVPWAKPAATQPLIDRFREIDKATDPDGFGVRWTIGNALEVVFDDSSFDDLETIARDKSFENARQMVVIGFGKSKRPEAVHVLLDLLSDPQVDGHAVKALGKLKAPEAKAALESKLQDPRAWVRTAAKAALAKLS